MWSGDYLCEGLTKAMQSDPSYWKLHRCIEFLLIFRESGRNWFCYGYLERKYDVPLPSIYLLITVICVDVETLSVDDGYDLDRCIIKMWSDYGIVDKVVEQIN